MNNYSTKDIFNIVKKSTIGILIPMFVLGLIFNYLGWSSTTFNEEKVVGFKAMMVFTATSPIYILIIFVLMFLYIFIGINIYKLVVIIFKKS